jgi:membrane protease YdiL (CAAX protease family)
MGICLATIYGVMLGWLRERSQGLLMPWATHIIADAVIFNFVIIGR